MKKAVLLGVGMAALSTVATHAGTMGAATTGSAYPAGFVIGGDVGYGYLSSLEVKPVPPRAPATGASSTTIGSLVWDVHGGYDLPILEQLLIGFEIGYKSLGKASFSSYETYPANYSGGTSDAQTLNHTVTLSQKAVDFLLTSRVYVLNGLNVFGKAGPAYVRSASNTHYNLNYPSGTSGTESNQSLSLNPVIWRLRPELAIGVGYSFKNNLDVHLMYTYINGSDFNEASSTLAKNTAIPTHALNSFPTDVFSGIAAYNAVSVGLSYYFG